MPAVKKQPSFETQFLRECVASYAGDVGFGLTAEAQMRRLKIYWTDVLHALRTGVVVFSDKLTANGAQWCVEGVTCDDERLALMVDVYVDRCQLIIVRVRRI